MVSSRELRKEPKYYESKGGIGASLVAQWKRICLPTQRTQVLSQGQEDPLEEGMATHSSILVWRNPWIEEPGSLVHEIIKQLDLT